MKKLQTLQFTKEYASEEIKTIPSGYIDKTICGCGLTTVALENNVNTIIAVPSVELIRNKVAQYPNERTNNSILGVYGGIDSTDIEGYLNSTEVIKIMVTYDSLWKVEFLLDSCHLVIDESNKLLASSKLKSSSKKDSKQVDVVTKVFDLAYTHRDTVSFISATPTPLEYMPEWISELDQIRMEWSNTSKASPILMERTYPYKSIVNEIIRPLNENDSITLGTSKIEKVIVFINSVNNIVKAIKSAKLDKKDVAIVSSDTRLNDLKIKGYNRLQDPTNLPKFTFVTSSGFEGIDLNDDKAISVVVSNTNRSYQMIDIMTDLKQAISRQRNKNNPHYGKFIYMYNQSIFSKTTEELTQELNKLAIDIEGAIKLFNFSKGESIEDSFTMLADKSEDFKTYTNYDWNKNEYTLNTNMLNSDKYFILNIREQYKKGFDIKGIYEDSEVVETPLNIPSIQYKDVAVNYLLKNNFEGFEHYTDYVTVIQSTVKLYNKVWTDLYYAKQMIDAFSDEYKQLVLEVQKSFKVGESYLTSEVKNTLNKIYKLKGINRKAKSTDLQEFMEVKNKRTSTSRLVEIISKTIVK